MREPERPLPRRVEALEVAVETGDAEHVQREREEAIELLLGPPALDELADLAADRRQHREQSLVGLADFAAEELHHAEHVRRRCTIGKPNAECSPSRAAATAARGKLPSAGRRG